MPEEKKDEGAGNTTVLTKTLIPVELHDRGWVKPFLEKPWGPETAADVFKKLDGAETLIGKKTLIPGADAKPEDVEAFFGKLRPAKADDYEIKAGENADAEFLKAFRESAYYAGMDKRQVSRQLEKLVPVLQARAKAQADADAARDAEFEATIKEIAGPDYEKKMARAQAAAKELVPEKARQFVDKMDDKSLILFVTFADALLTKYAGEDDFSGKGGAGAGSTGQDKKSLVDELHKLYASDGWKDFRHTDHEKTKTRVNEILASSALKA